MKKTFLLILIIVFSITESFACDCIRTNESLSKKVEKAFNNSDLIISGRVIEIASEESGASCGYKFEIGKFYLVYARKSTHFAEMTKNEFDFVTSACDRNLKLNKVDEKELLKLNKLNCKNGK